MKTLEYSELSTLDETEPLCGADEACLDEIREVLARHGRLNRFGVTLLHKHFDLAEDEILVEECDEQQRTLTTSPRKASAFPLDRRIETVWRFDGLKGRTCVRNCNKGTCSHVHQ